MSNIIMAVHQNSVSSVCQREQRSFYTPFTRGREKVQISFIPTNVLKIQTFSWICSARVSWMRPIGISGHISLFLNLSKSNNISAKMWLACRLYCLFVFFVYFVIMRQLVLCLLENIIKMRTLEMSLQDSFEEIDFKMSYYIHYK